MIGIEMREEIIEIVKVMVIKKREIELIEESKERKGVEMIVGK